MNTLKLRCLLLLPLFAIPYACPVIADDTGESEKAFQRDVLRSYEPSNIGMRTSDAYNNAKDALDNLTERIDSGYKQAKRRLDQMLGFMPSDEELNSPVDPARPDLKGLSADQISKPSYTPDSSSGNTLHDLIQNQRKQEEVQDALDKAQRAAQLAEMKRQQQLAEPPASHSSRDDSLSRLINSSYTPDSSSGNSLHNLIQNQREQEKAQDALDKAQRAAQLAEMQRQQRLADQQRQKQLAEQQRQQARAAQRAQAEAEAEIAQNRAQNADALLGVMGAFTNALVQSRTSKPVSAPSYQRTTAPASTGSSECMGGCVSDVARPK